MKQSVYFLRCGITTEISFISSKTWPSAVAGAVSALFDVPLGTLRLARLSSMRRFFEAGSEDC